MGDRLDNKRKIKNTRWRYKYVLVAIVFTLSVIFNSILPKTFFVEATENKGYEFDIASVEDDIESEEGIFELSKKAEKDDNGDINITLEVKVNKDKLPIIEKESLEDVESIKGYEQINTITLNEYITKGFKIIKDSLIVEIVEGENTKELNLEELKHNNSLNIDSENQLNISLNNIVSEKINFKYKINTNNDIQVSNNISLTNDYSETKKTEFKYNLSQGEEKVVKLPKVLVNVKEVILEIEDKESVIVEEENEGSPKDNIDSGLYTIDDPEIINGVNYDSSKESMYFPITIRDFKADYMVFEPFDRTSTPLLGGKGMVSNTLPSNKNISINETTITNMVNEISAQLTGKTYAPSFDDNRNWVNSILIKIENLIDGYFVPGRKHLRGYESGYKEELKDRVSALKNDDGSYNTGTYEEARTWYNQIKDRDYNSVKNQINSVYRYVYYHMHELFDTNPELNYTITGKQLNLVKEGNSNKYTFDSGVLKHEQGIKGKGFFPIDKLGFTKDIFHDARYYDEKNNYHNFHFTIESHSSFWVEQDKELEFEFSGDDDVWVYLNGQLVIDLGGLHERQASTFEIKENGDVWVDGKNKNINVGTNKWVDFDFYYMERHTDASNLKITTNIDFKPQVQVEKKAYTYINENKEYIDSSDEILVGETIYYEFKIKNNGNIDLNNVVIDDEKLNITINKEGVYNYNTTTSKGQGRFSITKTENNITETKNDLSLLGNLKPNGVIIISSEDFLKYEITNNDISQNDKGIVTNKVVVKANSDGGSVSREDIINVNVVSRASLRINKVISGIEENNANKTFTIMIKGDDGTQYNIEVKNGTEYTLNNLKYGVKYTISEIVPMNYNLTNITGVDNTIRNNMGKIIGANIVITSSNNNPLVTIANKKVNDKFWQSENKVINKFEFNGSKFEFDGTEG